MKKYLLFLFALSTFAASTAQKFSIAADRMNILYAGVDNPLTIAVENVSNKYLVVKASSGIIKGKDGIYVFRTNETGKTEIIIYKRTSNKLLKIGSSVFRVKELPLPVFKIGAARHSMARIELANQQFVRADLEELEIDARFPIDSFTVCVVSSDTCRYAVKRNIGGKIKEEIQAEFRQLKQNDVVIFKDIFAKGPDGISRELIPVMITIYK